MSWDELDRANTQSFDDFTMDHAAICDADLNVEVDVDAPVRQLDGLGARPAAVTCERCGARYPTAVPVDQVLEDHDAVWWMPGDHDDAA